MGFYTMGSEGIISPIKEGAMNKLIRYKDLLQCHCYLWENALQGKCIIP